MIRACFGMQIEKAFLRYSVQVLPQIDKILPWAFIKCPDTMERANLHKGIEKWKKLIQCH